VGRASAILGEARRGTVVSSVRMSLLEALDPAHAPALTQLAADLLAGSPADRAVLLNLREEDRVPEDIGRAFQEKLVLSTKPSAVERVKDACTAGHRALRVPAARRAEVTGAWCVYQKLDALLLYRYVDETGIDRRTPPPRVALERPFGRPATGDDRHYWTTTAAGADATVLRDRLGLLHYARGSQLFRIGVEVDADPARPLFTPTALDSEAHPAWRCPPPGDPGPWGWTRHLQDDTAAERELLARPHVGDPREATYVGQVATPPPSGYLAQRPL
jgi:hypothetical protein